MEIITDHKWKHFKYGYEVPKKVFVEDYDYLVDQEKWDGFIFYRKRWYHISDFMRVDKNSPFAQSGFTGYLSDSFFSGILIDISSDGESYRIATFIS